MPWYSTVSEALAGKIGFPAIPTQPDTWASAPIPPSEEPNELSQFWLSPRFLDASQALTRWGRLQLRDLEGNVVAADVSDLTR